MNHGATFFLTCDLIEPLVLEEFTNTHAHTETLAHTENTYFHRIRLNEFDVMNIENNIVIKLIQYVYIPMGVDII